MTTLPSVRVRFALGTTLVSFAFLLLATFLITPRVAVASNEVYVFSSGNTTTDQRILEVITSGGYNPTLGIQPGAYTGSEVDLTLYSAVVLQNSHNWASSVMGTAGQDGLVEYVQNGGGLITLEWIIWRYGNQSTAPIYTILPATYTVCCGSSSTTYSVDTADAVLNAGVSNSFTFNMTTLGGYETGLDPKAGAISFYSSSTTERGGLVGWDVGNGRVASFSTLMTSVELQNADLGTLLNNTIEWVGGESIPPERIFLTKRVGVDGSCNSSQLFVEAGTEVTYCYEVTNRSSLTLEQHTLVDDKLGTLIDDQAFTLNFGESYRFTTTAVINEDTLNVATWSAEDGSGTVISDTAQAYVSIAETDVYVQKWAYVPSVVAGDELTYYIFYRNWSNVAASNVWISDTLPAEMSYFDSTMGWKIGSQVVTLESTGDVVSWSMPELPPYSYGYLYMTVRITDTAVIDDVLENEVSISTVTADSNLANNTYQSTVSVEASRQDLSVQKWVYGSSQPGSTLNYYIYYRNIGNRTVDDVVITDTLPSDVSFLQYYDYYYNSTLEQNGNELVWTVGSLAPYQTGYIYLSVAITDNVVADTVLTNTVTIDGAGTDADTGNNTHFVTSTVVVPGRITGTVTLTDGTPIQNATAYAYQNQPPYGQGWSYTDADGNYTIEGLPAGDYYVYFYSQYGNEVYDDVTSTIDATLVSVLSGQTTTNIHAQFAPPVPPKATVSTGTNYVYVDPRTGESSIWINQSNPSDLTFAKAITCDNGTDPTNVMLVFATNSNGTFEYEMTSSDGTTFTGTIPASDLTRGTFSVEYDCGSEHVEEVVGHGLIDPSGYITDAVTGEPIVGATVELFTIDDWVPKDGPADVRPNTCHTLDSRPSVWNEMAPAPLIGRLGNPLADPQEIDPVQNPLLTDDTGYYAWDVAAGCWYIVVTAEGYETRVSPVVGVPPEVTDLDLTMTPIGVPTSVDQLAVDTADSNTPVIVIATLALLLLATFATRNSQTRRR